MKTLVPVQLPLHLDAGERQDVNVERLSCFGEVGGDGDEAELRPMSVV